MAQLIDGILVTLSLGVATLAVIRYFVDLARRPKGEAVSCSGCNSNCHPDIPDYPSLGLLRKSK